MSNSKRSMNGKRALWAVICLVLFLSTAIALDIGRRPFSSSTSNSLEKPSVTEVLNTVRAALPNHYFRLSKPAALGNTFTVTNTNDSGAGSLRQAISDANDAVGADTITFNIPASDPNCNPTTHVCTITPASNLPFITDPVTIDGYSQPGASANTNGPGLADNAVLLIEINGVNTGGSTGEGGLIIRTDHCTIKGLVINRARGDGIVVSGGTTNGNNTIQGCFIGTDPTGTVAQPNGGAGVTLIYDGNLIGGKTPADRNVISGNTLDGINVTGSNGNFIQGNFIGTDASGAGALGNGPAAHGAGVRLAFTASNNLIGGTGAVARNIISANGSGVSISNGLGAPDVTNNRVQGNYIGTDVTGASALGNVEGGVFINSPGNFVGGLTPGTGNVISGNGGDGVHIFSGDGSILQGNLIGTAADAVTPLGNSNCGISVVALNVSIGGTAAGAGNTIANNGAGSANGGGVCIDGGNDKTGNSVLGNSIFANTATTAGQPGGLGLGIDLAIDGVTPNDPRDTDSGPNNLQNFPVLTSVTSDGATTTIEGTLNSTSITPFRVEFFANDACDPSGFGEGQTFLGAAIVMTNGDWTADFTGARAVVLPAAVLASQVVTATATRLDSAGNPTDTSEFSQCIAVTVTTPTVTHFAVSAPASATAGSTFDFTVTALDQSNNPVTGYSGTVHFSSSDGQATLPADSTLTNGAGSFSITLKTAGNQTITATDITNTSVTGTSNSIAVTAGATHFIVNTPSTATAGSAFTFTVKALDSSNNLVAAYSGTVHFSSSDGQATLPADSTLTNGAGSFSATLNTAGNQTITATDITNSSITGTSNAIAVSAPAQGFAITSYVFAGGGGASANGGFSLFGTAGQFDTTLSNGGGFIIDSGFWVADTLTATTPSGANATASLGIVTVTFANVSTAGKTYLTPIDPDLSGHPPGSYLIGGLAFDIKTTAVYSGPITICFNLPLITDPSLFSRIKVLHSENGVLVDRTTSQDFASKTVGAVVNTLSVVATSDTTAVQKSQKEMDRAKPARK